MISMLRLINPPGHVRKSSRTPRYVRGAKKNPAKKKPRAWTAADTERFNAVMPASFTRSEAKAVLKKLGGARPKRKAAPKRAKRVSSVSSHGSGRIAYATRALHGPGCKCKRCVAKRKAAPKRKRTTATRTSRARDIAILARAVRAAAGQRKPRKAAKKASPKKGPRKMARKKTPKRGRARNAKGRFVKKAGVKRKRTRKYSRQQHAAHTRASKRLSAAAAPKRRRRRRKATRVVVVTAAPKRRRRKAARKTTTVTRRRVRRTRRVKWAPLPRRRKPGRRLVKVVRVKLGRRRRPVGLYRGRLHGKRHGAIVTSHMALRVKRNPIEGMKGMIMQGAMLYGGLLGMRAINKLIKDYVVSSFASSLPAQIAPIIPSAIGFIAAAFAPKVIKNSPQLVGGLQTGATLALLDAVVKNFVIPSLPANVQGYLSGIDDVGYGGYGRFGGYGRAMGEYLQAPRQLGAHVEEAMALDEYVQDGMHGFDVQEALADSEVQGMQSGYAAGSLAKTLFSV